MTQIWTQRFLSLLDVKLAHIPFDFISLHFCNYTERCQLEKPLKYFSILLPMKNDVWFEYGPWKKYNFVSFPSSRFILVIKLRKFDFENHEILYFLLRKKKKNWCRIWICPVKQCLIWIKVYCFSRILAINWEIWVLNFIETDQYFSSKKSVVRSKFLSVFFCLISIFWH